MTKIEFLYLELECCERCLGTSKELKKAVNRLGNILDDHDLDLRMIRINSQEKAERYNFKLSPTIRINKRDIHPFASSNDCVDCCELGEWQQEIPCRTWIYQGVEYEIPPVSLLTDLILKQVYGHKAGLELEISNACCEPGCCVS